MTKRIRFVKKIQNTIIIKILNKKRIKNIKNSRHADRTRRRYVVNGSRPACFWEGDHHPSWANADDDCCRSSNLLGLDRRLDAAVRQKTRGRRRRRRRRPALQDENAPQTPHMDVIHEAPGKSLSCNELHNWALYVCLVLYST